MLHRFRSSVQRSPITPIKKKRKMRTEFLVLMISTMKLAASFMVQRAKVSRSAAAISPARISSSWPLTDTYAEKSSSVVRFMASVASDDSAMSRSRAPFRMPKDSADDSVPQVSGSLAWNQLGLVNELVTALEQQRLTAPTPVQQLVIPELLKEPPQHIAFLAATGSGKTLAYTLPLLQQIKQQELLHPQRSLPKRPRLLILAPTRELVGQITSVVKALCHQIKLSSCAVTGGEDYGLQRRRLEKPTDIVIATPGRLTKHWKDQNIFLGKLEHVVIDEMDTMMEQGFHRELRQLLYPVLYHKRPEQKIDVTSDLQKDAPRMVLTSATMTQQVSKILGDTTKEGINAKRHYRKLTTDDSATDDGVIAMPPTQVLKAAGLHKAVPRLKQVFVDVGGTDKLSLLVDIVSSGGSGAAVSSRDDDDQALTMIFCNTAASCRAVGFALAEARIETLPYHGELNSAMRTANLQKFRQGTDARVLVCTDLAARGLDVPQVDHVVMFDFPLNALDYLHRSGRTARGIHERAGNGRVTALVSKRDKVLADAIQRAVQRGEPLDGLSSRKSDYAPGARLGSQPSAGRGGRGRNNSNRRGGRRSGRR